MPFRDIRSADVLEAISLLDDPIKGAELRRQLHFKPARTQRLVYKGRFYDSKAVVGIAHGIGTNHYLASADFTGGDRTVVPCLTRLGFHVDFNWLYATAQVALDRAQDRLAVYQYVVLLWAISRALSGLPRMTHLSEVRGELVQILETFAVSEVPPNPEVLWIALSSIPPSPLGPVWILGRPTASASATESEVNKLDPVAGLSEHAYTYVSGDFERNGFIASLIDVSTTLIGDEPGYHSLLDRLALSREDNQSDRSPGVTDLVAGVEEPANPRRRFRTRLTAAQNKAIEERAVQVTRKYFEDAGYRTEDVGATQSYDVHATRSNAVIKIEVKGTTTDGASVILTRNEVRLHRVEYPNNALAVVHNITLVDSQEHPTATGGELRVLMPWKIDELSLSPVAYEYQTGV